MSDVHTRANRTLIKSLEIITAGFRCVIDDISYSLIIKYRTGTNKQATFDENTQNKLIKFKHILR